MNWLSLSPSFESSVFSKSDRRRKEILSFPSISVFGAMNPMTTPSLNPPSSTAQIGSVGEHAVFVLSVHCQMQCYLKPISQESVILHVIIAARAHEKQESSSDLSIRAFCFLKNFYNLVQFSLFACVLINGNNSFYVIQQASPPVCHFAANIYSSSSRVILCY